MNETPNPFPPDVKLEARLDGDALLAEMIRGLANSIAATAEAIRDRTIPNPLGGARLIRANAETLHGWIASQVIADAAKVTP